MSYSFYVFELVDKEIRNIDNLNIISEEESTFADVYVATGWQTFKKLKKYRALGMLTCFFCQDLEYLLETLPENGYIYNEVKNFYDIKIPTFTMSHYLKNKLSDGRKIMSTSFNVEKSIYFDQKKKRNGICLFYVNSKKHRLPSLVLKIAHQLSKQYPNKPIYLYGSGKPNHEKFEHNNVVSLGELSLKETADLYNKTNLGICFSTTNPSRVGFEMIACGLPCIEADNEFTKYDLLTGAFIKVKLHIATVFLKP